ncbi:MAG: radical SAM protein [Thermoguttaceae bacterium]|jgi:biotin synthase
MQRNEILDWLRESDPARLDDLWRLADQTRQEFVGGEVHLRGLIELSNYCVRLCGYCGLRAGNAALRRYRMSDDEVLQCVRKAVQFGYGTVVLQSGEDPELTRQRIAGLVRRIKADTALAVTLSLGERDDDELAAWREAGADRYLLRFETSNRALYERIHPPRAKEPQQEQGGRHSCLPGSAEPLAGRQECLPHCSSGRQERLPHRRMAILATLARLGYEVGSGVMIGIPGQTYDDLADDIEWFARLDLDMIGVGPYLPHPDTPLADRDAWPPAPDCQQVPASEEMTYKVIALTRLTCPRTNIPATTALATLNRHEGRELGLVRGANILMPNLTPTKYRALYEIYPDKACIAESGEACHHCLSGRIAALGRQVGQGRGDSPNREIRLLSPDTGRTPHAPREEKTGADSASRGA